MTQQWRLRVQGKQRTAVSIDLLTAAVMALGEQLRAEQRERERAAAEGRTTPLCQPVPKETA